MTTLLIKFISVVRILICILKNEFDDNNANYSLECIEIKKVFKLIHNKSKIFIEVYELNNLIK